MNKITLLLLALIILNCKTNSDNTVPKTNGVKEVQSEYVKPTISLLQGIWAESEEENAIFFIKEESLYYVEDQRTAVPIKLKNDTLIIHGDLAVHCKIVKLTNDSLWYIGEFSEETTKLYKRK